MGTRNPQVDAWFERYTNPQRELVQAVRAAVLDADDRIAEAIKWQAPTFIYKGNIASFYPKTKTHASLMFHRGAELDDPDGLLEGEVMCRGSLASSTPRISSVNAVRFKRSSGAGSNSATPTAPDPGGGAETAFSRPIAPRRAA